MPRRGLLFNFTAVSDACSAPNWDYFSGRPDGGRQIEEIKDLQRTTELTVVELEELLCFTNTTSTASLSSIPPRHQSILSYLEAIFSNQSNEAAKAGALQLLVADAASIPSGSPNFLDQVLVELFAPDRLFRDTHGLSGCGQLNCRFLHRVCWNALRGHFNQAKHVVDLKQICQFGANRPQFLKQGVYVMGSTRQVMLNVVNSSTPVDRPAQSGFPALTFATNGLFNYIALNCGPEASAGALLCNRVRPGMAVQTEIKTGRRRIIQYLLSPISQAVSEAGRER